MKVVFYSFSGNVRRFLDRTGLEDVHEITEETIEQKIEEPYILVTGTIGFGEVPEPVQYFLEHSGEYLRGVAASGNRNWGQNFAKGGRTVAKQYDVPLLMKFEVQGSDKEVIEFRDKVVNFNENVERKAIQSY